MRGKGHFKSPKHYGLTYDAPQPRLESLRQIRWGNRVRDDLTGETKKAAISKVSLPKFSWDKKDDNRD